MSKEIKEPYSIWLKSPDVVDLLKKNIVKVGYPLEIYVKDILRQKGYVASNSYYEQSSPKNGNKILREIDIYAFKIIKKYFHRCFFNFRLLIVGECKYSSTNDYFAFKSDEKIEVHFLLCLILKMFLTRKIKNFFSSL